jgi:hypothetical protein
LGKRDRHNLRHAGVIPNDLFFRVGQVSGVLGAGTDSGRAIQGRRFTGLTQSVEISDVEGAERGFDRGAEAGYAVAHRAAKECNPNAGTREDLRGTHGRRTTGMQFVIKLGTLPRRRLITYEADDASNRVD